MQQSIDSPVDPPDEHVSRQESNRARQETIHGARQEAVAEEQQTRYEASDVEVENEVPHAVAKHPECAAATREEALPPPVVVLCAELAVGSDDCHFADRYHQDRRHGAQKAKHVVVSALVLPQVLEDKQKLNEQHREWTQAGQESPADAVQIPWLWRDLTRNGGRLGRVLPGSSQRARRLTSVPKGMAVLEACAHTKRLRMKMRQKASPGKNNAV